MDNKVSSKAWSIQTAIYKDADKAIMELSKYKPKDRNTIKNPFNKYDLIEAYIKYQGEVNLIASALNRSYRDIVARIARMNLPTNQGISEPYLAVVDFYRGENIKNLLTRPNVDYENFSQIIRILGKELSSRIEKRKINTGKSPQFSKFIMSEQGIEKEMEIQATETVLRQAELVAKELAS